MIVAVTRVNEINFLMGRNCKIAGRGVISEVGEFLEGAGKVVTKGIQFAGKAASKVMGVVSTLFDVGSSVLDYLQERERTVQFRTILESEIEVLNVLKLEYESLKRVKEEIEMAIEEKRALLIQEFQKKVENKIKSVKALVIEDISVFLATLRNSIMEIRKKMREILKTDGKTLDYARLEMKYYKLVREFVAFSNLIARCREVQTESENFTKELVGIGG